LQKKMAARRLPVSRRPRVRFHPAAMNRLTHVAQALTASPASAGDFRGALLLLLYVVVILPGLHALTAAAVIPAR
jgi:hypothetical protein